MGVYIVSKVSFSVRQILNKEIHGRKGFRLQRDIQYGYYDFKCMMKIESSNFIMVT